MYKMLAIGFSAGGMPLITQILRALPPDYPLPIVVVAHLPEGRESCLAELLNDIISLSVTMAVDKQPVLPGKVYIAPRDTTC